MPALSFTGLRPPSAAIGSCCPSATRHPFHFRGLGRIIGRRRRLVLAIALVLAAFAAVWWTAHQNPERKTH
jgi:hypothetical protein